MNRPFSRSSVFLASQISSHPIKDPFFKVRFLPNLTPLRIPIQNKAKNSPGLSSDKPWLVHSTRSFCMKRGCRQHSHKMRMKWSISSVAPRMLQSPFFLNPASYLPFQRYRLTSSQRLTNNSGQHLSCSQNTPKSGSV